METCYKEMYTALFNAVTDAVRLLEGLSLQEQVVPAIQTLKEAQMQAEDYFINHPPLF